MRRSQKGVTTNSLDVFSALPLKAPGLSRRFFVWHTYCSRDCCKEKQRKNGDTNMSSILDNYIGIHAQALQVRTKKTELLASNLANVDTPGYKAKDVDFRAALERASASTGGSMNKTHPRHLDFGEADSDLVQFRVPTQPSVDGNTVESHVEKGEFLDNTMRYQATLQFLGGKFKSLKSAIKGE